MHHLQQRTIKKLISAQIGAGLGTSSTVAAGSLLVTSITGSEKLAGLAQTFSVLGAAALAIPLARLTSQAGRRGALSMGYSTGVIGSLVAILGGVHRNVAMMFIGSFLVGAASASAYQARFAAIDLADEKHRARQLSLVVWGSTVGAVLGPNLMQPAGTIAEHFHLPKLVGPYMISALTLTFAATLIFLFLKPDPYLTARAESGIIQKAQQNTRAALSHISKNPIALFAILTIAMGHVAMVSVMVMTPVHMAHVDVSLRIIGLVISVHVIGMYALSPLVGTISDRLGQKTTIHIGFLILICSAIVSGTARADNVVQLGIGLFLLGFGWSFTLIAGSALLSLSVDLELKTSSQGASDLVMNLAAAIGGALAGVIIAALSYGWLCFFAAIPILILGLWSIRLHPIK